MQQTRRNVLTEILLIFLTMGAWIRPSHGRWGDGICWPIERRGGTYLERLETRPVAFDAEESPFGFLYAKKLPDYVSDLGVKWIRVNAVWKTVQPTEKDVIIGSYRWHSLERNWKYEEYQDKNVNFLVTIALIGIVKNSYIPNVGSYDRHSYIEYVEKLVERYDGDGIDDAPNLIAPIKYWQVENEPPKRKADFAELQRITYHAIKGACSDCKVLIGGIGYAKASSQEQFDKDILPILDELNGSCFDIIDFHWFGTADDYDTKESFEIMKGKLKEINFDADNMPFWISEMGTYSGDPHANTKYAGGIDPPYQSEQQQAQSLIRRYVSQLAIGIDKIFWGAGILEGFFGDGGYFDYTGLIYDGCDVYDGEYVCAEDSTYDMGPDVRKLGYYTYKLMTEILEGSDWHDVETIMDGQDNLNIYRFKKKDTGEPIWVVWWDCSDEPGVESKEVKLDIANMEVVKIIEAVPDAESGADLVENDYPSFFKTETKTVENEVVHRFHAPDPAPIYILFEVSEIAGDIDHDRGVDLVDFALLASHWLETDCDICDGSDLTDDGNVDFDDLTRLTESWLAGVE